MEIRTVGVVGAGTIGRGVAQDFAQHGFRVILVDSAEEQLVKARENIRHLSRFKHMFRGGNESSDSSTLLDSIESGTDLALLAEADFVVENVTENWEVKRSVHEAIDQICLPHVIFAVNTSAIPITRVASASNRPARVLGLHFMNPVPLIRTVEVVRGHHTSDESLEVAMNVLDRLGKEGIVVGDFPGFVTNRVLMLTINEAAFCLQDQVASAQEVDRIFKGCFGHRMGPLETADLIGLDTILNSIKVLYESYRDSKFRPAPLLQRMVDAGLLGRKSGEGFYDYSTTHGTFAQ
ncbi:3-hydroxyacyl-CoA dehydrogenase family protein [Plantactinospora sp. ZYX-F-223]|uniref:3-hydroxyacyl-CoA dehydrogenase family protein n=1 Tax=Plantactinospora sp. ZYX-F-223 TaxID=3144103 RepID=UPI0031FDA51A